MSESFEPMSPPPLTPFAVVHLAAAGYLARYSGRTRDAYSLDLKTFFAWCAERSTQVFAMTRLNRPGESGDSVPWEGWSHVWSYVEEVPGRAT